MRKVRQGKSLKHQPASTVGVGASRFHAHARDLIEQRDTLMSQIAFLRSRANARVALVENAASLLTRHWSRSTWHGREELLRAARFMLSAQWLAGPAMRRTHSV